MLTSADGSQSQPSGMHWQSLHCSPDRQLSSDYNYDDEDDDDDGDDYGNDDGDEDDDNGCDDGDDDFE